MGFFVATDALGKVLVTKLMMPLFQMLALRSIGMIVVLTIHTAATTSLSSISITSKDAVVLAMRAVLEALSSWFFNLSLVHLPMATAIAIVQALPLAVMLGAALVGERVSGSGWLVALIGFGGVVVIVRPTTDGIDAWAACALAAVACMAVRDLSTRALSAAVPSSLVSLVGTTGVGAFSLGASLAQHVQWVGLTLTSWACVVGAALTASAAFTSSVLLMRSGALAFVTPRHGSHPVTLAESQTYNNGSHTQCISVPSVALCTLTAPHRVCVCALQVQPFRYTLLLWAAAFGWLVFGEWPDAPTVVGGAIVVCAGYANVRMQIAETAAASARPVEAKRGLPVLV
jgi:S-adenosylmethionine uptake transporter